MYEIREAETGKVIDVLRSEGLRAQSAFVYRAANSDVELELVGPDGEVLARGKREVTL